MRACVHRDTAPVAMVVGGGRFSQTRSGGIVKLAVSLEKMDNRKVHKRKAIFLPHGAI